MTGLNKDTVLCRDDAGASYHLELSTGRTFDLQGNQTGKLEVVENTQTAMLSDYVSRCAEDSLVRSLAMADAPRAERTQQYLLSDRLVKMDLGVGDVHIPTVLPNFATGYKNEAPMADVVCPPMLVNHPAGKFYSFGREDGFQRATPIIGAAGASVPEISPRIALSNFSTQEYAISSYVTTQIQAAADQLLRIKQAAARRLMTVLTLEREVRVANLLTADANYDSSLVYTVPAGSQWNGGPNADPLADLMNRIELSLGEPTGILMSQKVWNHFIRTPAVQRYFQNKTGISPLPTTAEFSQLFGLPPIYIARMKYFNTAGVLDYIWGNSVILFRQPEQMPPTAQDDVTTAITFRWNVAAPDGVTTNGWTTREYFDRDRGSMGGTRIVIVHHDGEVFTSRYAGGIIQNVLQLAATTPR